MNTLNINVKNEENVKLPQKGNKNATGYDIFAASNPEIKGEQGVYENGQIYYDSIDYIQYLTNLKIEPAFANKWIGDRLGIFVLPRSSISKYNLVLANSPATIDVDYRGNILLRFKYVFQPRDFLISDERVYGVVDENKIYNKNDKIAQMVFMGTYAADFEIVEELSDTERGEGGFGSTGS